MSNRHHRVGICCDVDGIAQHSEGGRPRSVSWSERATPHGIRLRTCPLLPSRPGHTRPRTRPLVWVSTATEAHTYIIKTDPTPSTQPREQRPYHLHTMFKHPRHGLGAIRTLLGDLKYRWYPSPAPEQHAHNTFRSAPLVCRRERSEPKDWRRDTSKIRRNPDRQLH